MSAALRLRVVAGDQRGATLPLAAGTTRTVGCSLDRDIVLRGAGLAARALTLEVAEDGTGATLIAEADGVRVAGRALAVGERAALAPDARVECGALAFAVESRDRGGEADTARQTLATADIEALVAAAVDAEGSSSSPFARAVEQAGAPGAPRARPARDSRALVRGGAIAAVGCAALALWVWQGGQATNAPSPSLEARLAETFPALALERVEDGAPRVTGYLPRRADAIRLERWLDAQPERPRSAVAIDERLAARVEDVFRVNGIEARVSSLVGGEARVETAVADAEELARVEARVREDVPQLAAMAIENTPPPPAEETPYDPGKRISLVVADTPAYIVTDDRARYFLGSPLPSGHRIVAIEKNVVRLEKGGETTELQF